MSQRFILIGIREQGTNSANLLLHDRFNTTHCFVPFTVNASAGLLSSIEDQLKEWTLALEVDSSGLVEQFSHFVVAVVLLGSKVYCSIKGLLRLIKPQKLLDDLEDNDARANRSFNQKPNQQLEIVGFREEGYNFLIRVVALGQLEKLAHLADNPAERDL